MFKGFLPERDRFTSKGDYGRAIIIGGSRLYTGAPLLSCNALMSLAGGAGYGILYVPASLWEMYALREPQLIVKRFPDKDGFLAYDEKTLGEITGRAGAIALGMGAGPAEDLPKIIAFLAERFKGTLILDADALNALARSGLAPLEKAKARMILTPHVGEFARLSGLSIEEIKKDPVTLASSFALEHHCILILKDAWTVISDGKDTYLNKAGNAGLAKAGSGDILSGLLAGLFAQPNLPKEPAKLAAFAAFTLGKAAEKLAETKSEYSFLARDLVEKIGEVFKDFS